MLSFSTKGSAEHARVAKVREALRIAKVRQPNLLQSTANSKSTPP
jgi:phosphotransacetylase